jgi:hypothetical protein
MQLVPDIAYLEAQQVRHAQPAVDPHCEEQVIAEISNLQIILDFHDQLGIADRLDFPHITTSLEKWQKKKHPQVLQNFNISLISSQQSRLF